MIPWDEQYALFAPLVDGWIRLVEILPGTEYDLVQTRCTDFALREAPKYNALSYTWGSTTEDLRYILRNDEDFIVTGNLFDALQKFRSEAEPVWMWIDALCINQVSDAECTQQIGLMVDIYSKADEVSIWLGPHHQDPELEFLFRVADSRVTYAEKAWLITRPAKTEEAVVLLSYDPYCHQVFTAARSRHGARGLETGEELVLSDGSPFSIPAINVRCGRCADCLSSQESMDTIICPSTVVRKPFIPAEGRYKHREPDKMTAIAPIPLLLDLERKHVERVAEKTFDTFEEFLLEVIKPAELELSDADMVRVLHARRRLLQRPYWTRAWIVQEIIVSQVAVVHWGRYKINFDTLWSVFGSQRALSGHIKNFALDDLKEGSSGGDAYQASSRLCRLDRSLIPQQNFGTYPVSVLTQLGYHKLIVRDNTHMRVTLADLLYSYAEQQALDPRDRIFCLLNTLRAFASHKDDMDFARSFCDYGLDRRAVFTAVAAHFVKTYRARVPGEPLNIHLLGFCQYLPSLSGHDNDGDDDALPSWVPAWDVCRWVGDGLGMRRIHEIDVLIPYRFRIEDDSSVLVMAGHIVDTVGSRIELLEDYESYWMLDEVDLYRRIEADGGGKRYGDQEAIFAAFWRTVIADSTLGHKTLDDLSTSFDQTEQDAASLWVASCLDNYTTIVDTWGEMLFARRNLRAAAIQILLDLKFRNEPTSEAVRWPCDTEALKARLRIDLEELERRGIPTSQAPDLLKEPKWPAGEARQKRLALCNPTIFFESRTGFFALGPRGVRPGDVIALLGGYHFPVCLRERPEHKGQYQVVGRAWVSGLMYASDDYYKDWSEERVCDITFC